MRDEKATVEVVLKGQAANASLKEMEAALRAIRADLRTLPKDSDAFTKRSAEYKKLSNEVRNLNSDLRGTGSAFESIERRFKSFATFAGIAIAFRTIASEMRDIIRIQKEFDKALKNLQAITGASAQDVKFYADEAKRMGANIQGGAAAAVEAFKLMASAKPELLKNKEALVEITDAAITLSQASGLTLPQAAENLGSALNAFSAPAQDAAKFINVMASAAQLGAREIPFVTEALSKFGGVAEKANVSIEESAAAIEILGAKIPEASIVGTNLRGVLIKLQVLAAENKREFRGLTGELDLLGDKVKDVTFLKQKFGDENLLAIQTLIAERDALKKLTDQVTGTKAAYEQAAINTDTLEQSMVKATNAYENFILSLKNSKGVLNWFFNGVTAFFNGVSGVSQFNEQVETIHKLTGASRELSKTLKDLGLNYLDDADARSEVFAVQDGVGGRNPRVNQLIEQSRAITAYAQAYETAVKKIKSSGDAKEQNTKLDALSVSQMKELKALYESGGITLEAYTIKMRYLGQATIGAISAISGNKPSGGGAAKGPTDSEIAAAKAAHEKLIAELQKLTLENSEAQMNEFQKKDAEIWREHFETLDRINKDSLLNGELKEKAIFALKKNTSDKIIALEKEMNDKLEEEKKKHSDTQQQMLNNDMQNEIDAITARYDAEIAYNQQHNLDVAELEEAKQQAILAIRLKYAEQNKAAGLDKSPEDRVVELQRQINDVQMYYNQLEQIGSAFYQIEKNRQSEEMNAAEAKYQADIAREKRLLDKKLISQEDYDAHVAKLDMQKQNRERLFRQKQYQQEKNAARYNTVINGAEAIAQIWSKHAAFPPTAFALSALSGGVTLAKLALIEAQQPPAYAQGGLHDPGGMVDKATLFGSSTGRPFIAGEAGAEYIVPSWMLQQPIVANQVAMMEAMRTNRSYAGGGSTVPEKAAAGTGGGGNNAMSFGDLAAAINRLNSNLEGGIGVNYDQFTRTMNSIENAKSISRVS